MFHDSGTYSKHLERPNYKRHSLGHLTSPHDGFQSSLSGNRGTACENATIRFSCTGGGLPLGLKLRLKLHAEKENARTHPERHQQQTERVPDEMVNSVKTAVQVTHLLNYG